MNFTEIKKQMIDAAKMKPSASDFSDLNTAVSNALRKYFGISKDASLRDLRQHQNAVFALIEEVVDEVVPQKVEDRTGDFAEIRNFGRDEDVVFDVPTAHNSRRRMYKSIKKGARGGIYKAYKLDGYKLDMQVRVESVGYMMTLEDILTGRRTVQELVNILADAWVEKIYYEVFQALSVAALEAPSVNKINSLTGLETDNFNSLDKVIRVIKAYGSPVIMGFSQHIAELDNALDTKNNTIYPDADANDIRNQGYVAMYKGVPVIELPNYLVDATNENWLFDEDIMFILPADERPVKVGFKGESYTAEVEQPHGGMEWHNHRMMGTTVLFSNSIGSVKFNGNND